MSGPQGPAAEGRDRLKAGHADREQVIEALKDAFVQGMLAKDEFDLRVGQTLASQTYADLAALTADLPSGPPATRPARPPAPLRRRPLARAAAGAGACLVIAAVALRGAFILDPGPYPPSNGANGAGMVLFVAICAALAAPCFLIYGVCISVQQRRSRRQLPPGPGLGGHVLDGERHGGTGHGPKGSRGQLPPQPGQCGEALEAKPDDRPGNDLTLYEARGGVRARRGRDHGVVRGGLAITGGMS